MTLSEILLTEFLGFLRDVANKAIWIVLVYWAVNKIIKNVPHWMETYQIYQRENRTIQWAKKT